MNHGNDILDSPFEGQEKPCIYSSTAIAGFSFFFSTIFGGIMAYQNLSRVGKKGTGAKVLLAGFGWVIFSIFLNYQVGIPRLFSLFVNMGAAWGMGHYVSDNYIPGHKNMPKRKIWVPLAIGLAIILLLLVIVFSSEIPDQD